jgi:hypothetical protein
VYICINKVLTIIYIHGIVSYNLIGGLTMSELNLACKKLDLLIKSGIDLDRSKAIAREWKRMGKLTYKKRIISQKIDNLRKAK